MDDPSRSPDPFVRAIAERRRTLATESARLWTVLRAYATMPATVRRNAPVVSALNHYPFSEGTQCGCYACAEWDLRRSELIEAIRLVPKGHKWSICACTACRFVGRIHLNYLAATNTRDLLIETSFHARHHSPFGEQVMSWLEDELKDPRYTVNWRAQEMSRHPLDRWLRRCEEALGPVVSGAVFRDGMHAMDARVHFASSLVAEGAIAA